jgi:hypothetical protein
MGGIILRNRRWDWTIFSLCRESDADRALKFRRVCEFYNAKGIISDLDDEVLAELDRVYPGDNNEELAESIAYRFKRYGGEGPHWQSEF